VSRPSDTAPSRLETLFERALELAAEERPAFLREECPDDPHLRERLLRMLEQDEEGTKEYLLSPVSNVIDRTRSRKLSEPVDRPIEDDPEEVGAFRIINRIGEGGMGRVYLAEHKQDPQLLVALKVMRPGAGIARVASRFENERQVLGMMDHHAICLILDGGTTSHGLPYFVMEYVKDARSLTRYAFENNLDLRERLELFLPICEAVDHGHGKGVLHRDLKPSNILVGPDGAPKLIDFGIARSFDEYGRDTTHLTEAGQLLGTLQYMSPEQILGKPLDERSDVYSLGVILYELLTRQAPYDVSGKSLVEAARIIEEEEPTRPSQRRIELHGDVETILLKALQKEPHRRYASAADLGRDIRRFLDFRPIVARNPSLVQQASLFVRRHPRLLTAAVLVFVSLFAGVVVSVFWAIDSTKKSREARVAAEEARQAREDAEAVTDFLTLSLATVDPRRNSKAPTVERLVRSMTETIPEAFRDRPTILGPLLNTFGRTYEALGRYEKAQVLLTEAHGMLEKEFGPDDRRTLKALVALSSAHHFLGRERQAVELLAPRLPRMREVLGEDDRDLATAIFNLGWIAMGEGSYEQAEEYLLEALEMRSAIHGETALVTLEVQDALAWVYDGQGLWEKGFHLFQYVYDTQEQVHGEVNSETLNSLGLFYQSAGLYQDAEVMYERALEKDIEALGNDHPDTLVVMANMGIMFEEMGRLEAAEGLLGEASERQIDRLGIDHPSTLGTLAALGRVKNRLGFSEEAEEILADVVERISEHPARSGEHGAYLVEYGRCLVALGRLEEAEPVFLDASAALNEAWGPNTYPALETAQHLEELYGSLGQPEDARHWGSIARSIRDRTE